MKKKVMALVIVLFSLMISGSVFAEGYLVTSDLWIRAVINTVEKGPIDAVFYKGGEKTTSRGDTVIWGYFYANPDDVSWGDQGNPDLYVKIWFDVTGRIDVNYFHVSVPNIEVFSDYPYDGTCDQYGTTTMDYRYIRHEYWRPGDESDWSSGFNTKDAMLSVIASSIGGSGNYTIRAYEDGRFHEHEIDGTNFINNSGIDNFFGSCTRPIFPSNVEVGHSWESSGTIDDVPVTITANVLSTSERVVTSAGQFENCIKIVYSYSYEHDPGVGHHVIRNITRYFKENIGIVKMIVERATQTETVTLISYSISGTGTMPLEIDNEWTYEWDQFWWWENGNTETFKVTQVS